MSKFYFKHATINNLISIEGCHLKETYPRPHHGLTIGERRILGPSKVLKASATPSALTASVATFAHSSFELPWLGNRPMRNPLTVRGLFKLLSTLTSRQKSQPFNLPLVVETNHNIFQSSCLCETGQHPQTQTSTLHGTV